jgi:hypothetical protein
VPEEKKIDARALLAMLRRHYLPENVLPAWIFLPEIGAPDSNRRADLICQGLAGATGRRIVGHELKVSRADLLHELDDLSKPDPWLRYCDQWWLVVSDPALLKGLDLPERWGIMAPPSGRRTRSMTVIRDAPIVKIDDQGAAFRTIAAKVYWDAQGLRAQVKHAQDDSRYLREQIEKLRFQPNPNRPPTAHQQWGLDVAKELVRLNRLEFSALEIEASRAAELLFDVQSLEQMIRRLETQFSSAIRQMQGQHAFLGDYLEQAKKKLAERKPLATEITS